MVSLTNNSRLVVHTEPDTSDFHLFRRNNELHCLIKERCCTVILNQRTIIVDARLTNAWLNATLFDRDKYYNNILIYKR